MKRLHGITILSFVLSALSLQAQRASIEFTTQYASSTIRIAPQAIGHNGATMPITFNTTVARDRIFDGAIITSSPIFVETYRSVGLTIQGTTTVYQADPIASKGCLRAVVDVVDAETGIVLQKEIGLDTFIKNTAPGLDTNTTQHLSIDLTKIHARNIFLRITGMSMFGHIPAPQVLIDNSPGREIEQVH